MPEEDCRLRRLSPSINYCTDIYGDNRGGSTYPRTYFNFTPMLWMLGGFPPCAGVLCGLRLIVVIVVVVITPDQECSSSARVKISAY